MRPIAAVLLALFTAAASHPDPLRVSPRPAFASFASHGTTSIVAAATDAAGNVYVTGTTNAPDFPVRNASQPDAPEARILRTTDLGATWTRIPAPREIAVVVPDPADAQTLFGLSDTTIYKTSDAGRSWRRVWQFQTRSGLTNGQLIVDPANHLRVAAYSPDSPRLILRSLDGGETWTPAPCPSDYCAGPLAADPSGSGAFLVRGSPAYLSRDWGSTYQPLGVPGPGNVSTAAFDPLHRGWIYAGTSAGTQGGFYLSTDFGVTWTAKASPPDLFSATLSLFVDPGQANHLIATTPAGLFESTDGAASWVRRAGSFVDTHTAPAILGSNCGATPTLVARVSGSGSYAVAFSADFGATWTAPQLSLVEGVAAAGCSVYVTRSVTTDAFVAKLSPDGAVQWATYLGGLDQDTPVALAVDPRGAVYVAGTTASPDFPATAPAIGPRGPREAFVARFSPTGALEMSVLVGGEGYNDAAALALDDAGNANLAGRTNSRQFPTSPGALVAAADLGAYTGFLVKLAPGGTPIYSTLLGPAYTFPGALLVDAQGQPVIAGSGAVPGFEPPNVSAPHFVMRLDSVASRVLNATYLGASNSAPSAIAADSAGNLVIAGATSTGSQLATPGAFQAPATSGCPNYPLMPLGGDVYIAKLRASDWQPVYIAQLHAPCTARPGALLLDASGAPTVALSTGAGIPLRSPISGGPTCSNTTAAIVKLSADGARLDFSTYLDSCGVPAISLAKDGSLLAGAGPDLLRLRPAASSPSLDGVANAFSGDATAVVSGELYTLTLTGAPLPSIDLGLTAQALPLQLGGVEVRFDGRAAQIVQTAPGRVIAVVPQLTIGRDAARRRTVTTVQLFVNGAASNAVDMPVVASRPGLLTNEFLAPAYHAAVPDAYALNEDGTINSASNPAAVGSTMTFFATGLGPAPLYPSWNTYSAGRTSYPEVTVAPLPGFLPAVSQVKVVVPNAAEYTGADAGNGVRRGYLGLRFQQVTQYTYPIDSNAVGFYFK